MLTGKQKRWLRRQAHNLEPLVQVGKLGLGETVFMALDQALTARELVKVKVLTSCPEPMAAVAAEITAATGSELVQKLGHSLLLYRENPENKTYNLSGR